MKISALSITINGFGNDAFQEQPDLETAQLLRRLADRIESISLDYSSGPIRDTNGNTVGHLTIITE